MRTLLTVLSFLAVMEACAQGNDLASINYSQARIRYNDTPASSANIDIKLKIPLFHNNRNTFLIAPAFKNLMLENYPASFPKNVMGISLQAIWSIRLTKRTSLGMLVQGGIFSDMADVNRNDIRYSYGFRYKIQHNKKLSTGFGLAYSKQFFGNQVIPFIEVDYKPNERWHISGQFPIKPKVMYRISKKVNSGIELTADGSSYRLSEKDNNNQYLQINQWTVYFTTEYAFAKKWLLNASLGYCPRQVCKLYNDATVNSWTVITFPVGTKDEPIRRLENKSMNFRIGIAFVPF
jgi:hypothetical protein